MRQLWRQNPTLCWTRKPDRWWISGITHTPADDGDGMTLVLSIAHDFSGEPDDFKQIAYIEGQELEVVTRKEFDDRRNLAEAHGDLEGFDHHTANTFFIDHFNSLAPHFADMKRRWDAIQLILKMGIAR